MPITDPVAFIKALLADPEFRREFEEEDCRKWADLGAVAGVGWRERGIAGSMRGIR